MNLGECGEREFTDDAGALSILLYPESNFWAMTPSENSGERERARGGVSERERAGVRRVNPTWARSRQLYSDRPDSRDLN